MTLSKEEARLFFKLYLPLIGYANTNDGSKNERPLYQVRKVLYNKPEIIANFLKHNPEKFDKDKLSIVSGWQRFIRGNFILIKSFKKYGVLLTVGSETAKAYGVVGITEAVIDMAAYGVGTYFEEVILLPWKDKVIWDGLFCLKPVIIGRNYMRSFTEEYEKIRQVDGIIECM